MRKSGLALLRDLETFPRGRLLNRNKFLSISQDSRVLMDRGVEIAQAYVDGGSTQRLFHQHMPLSNAFQGCPRLRGGVMENLFLCTWAWLWLAGRFEVRAVVNQQHCRKYFQVKKAVQPY